MLWRGPATPTLLQIWWPRVTEPLLRNLFDQNQGKCVRSRGELVALVGHLELSSGCVLASVERSWWGGMRGLRRKSKFAACVGPKRHQPAVAAVLSAVTFSGWRNLVDRATSDITGSSVWLSGRFLRSVVTVYGELCRDGNEGRCLFFPACARVMTWRW